MLVIRLSFEDVKQTELYDHLLTSQNNPPMFMPADDIGYPQSPSDLREFQWDVGDLIVDDLGCPSVRCVAFYSLSDIFLELERFYKSKQVYQERYNCLSAATEVMQAISGRIDLEETEKLLGHLTI